MISFSSMRYLGMIIISALLHACVSLDADKAMSSSSALQSDDDAAQNLAAIRALFPQQPRRSASFFEKSDNRSAEIGTSAWPPDWLSAYFLPAHSTDQGADFSSVYVPFASSSSSKSRTVRPDVPVRIPQVITPSRSLHIDSTPPVPAHMMPAPIGSAFPGASRCTPDLLGGQRCRAN